MGSGPGGGPQAAVGALLLAALAAAAPAPAHADVVFAPFYGQSFAQGDPSKTATIGASLASTALGAFGFEADFGRTSAAAGSTTFAENSRVTTFMGNALFGIPFGRLRPYAVAGLGWMQSETPDGGEMSRTSGLGLGVGAGAMGFFSSNVGVRVDLRYLRGVTTEDIEKLPRGSLLEDFVFGPLSFWRMSAGLALRF